MSEGNGKLETTYEWTCAACGTENRVLDDQRCEICGKEITDEKVLRHRRLTPTPMRIGVLI